MARKWTELERKRQAALTRKQKPWLKSTGPKTPEGKTESSLNGLKHGLYTPEFRKILRALEGKTVF